MYAQVVVPSYKGPGVDSFSYEVPPDLEIKIGQLVTVPFGKRKETGIVLEIEEKRLPRFARNDKEVTIKSIDSLVFEKPFLLPYQMELLKWMAQYYLATMGNCLNAMLPEMPGKFPISNSTFQISKASQTLIMVPIINNIPQTTAIFPKATRPVIYNSELTPQGKLQAWLRTLGGQADYIFGTRQAIFFPFTNLKKIIILNEHDDAYKDQRSPFYDTLTIAEKISQLLGAKIQIVDSAPRISTYFNHREEVKIATSRSVIMNVTRNDKPAVDTKITSLIDDKLSGNKTAISYVLENAISEAVEQKGRVLLFLNKKKESGTFYCRVCKSKQTLSKEPITCPNCGSTEIWFGSVNINSLAKQATLLFPNTEVNIINQKPSFAEASAGRPTTSNQKPAIDIATSSVFYQLLPKRYNLVAAISIDSTLNIPEFSSPEKTYSQITNLKRLALKQFLLQTYQVENATLQQAVDGNYAAFYNAQLNERQALSYPPFGLLIKLVFKGKNPEKTFAKAEDLANKIKYLIPNTKYLIPNTLLGPFEPYYKKTAPTYHLILKIPIVSPSLPEKEKALKEINDIVSQLNIFKIADQIIVDPLAVN